MAVTRGNKEPTIPVKDAAAKVKKAPVRKSSVKEDKKEKSSSVKTGDEVPDITVLDENGNDINFMEFCKRHSKVVLFVYPRASTPGCTRQACGFRDYSAKWKDLGYTIVGLSSDAPVSQTRFINKYKLNYTLLSDKGLELLGALGALKAGIKTIRSHFLIKDGKFTSVNLNVRPDDSYNNALEEATKSNDEIE